MRPLEEAIQLASHAHAGQVDKQGQPYILHCLRVMLAMESHGEEHMIVGVLHDLVEDTPHSFTGISERFGAEVAVAIAALTRWPEEDYTAYIERTRANPIARLVKLADIKDNLGRIDALPLIEQVRLGPRYFVAQCTLQSLQ